MKEGLRWQLEDVTVLTPNRHIGSILLEQEKWAVCGNAVAGRRRGTRNLFAFIHT